ncbi:GGDEF domain-containing protein [Paenibacillus sp. JSM ZJ436]|uniref:GGDEF domain-containing protein n=1 Tax=Paenibacillus sp. JSM ZJ436 TaxID=3376190 RepID=UPI00379B2BDE
MTLAQIGDIAETIPVVSPDTNCRVADEWFKQSHRLEGIAVVGETGKPALLTRNRFYQHVGTQYGYNIYIQRPVKLIMNRSPLVVDASESIIDVSLQAMNRAEEELYDVVLVLREDQLLGAVSIRRLLLEVADIRAEKAAYLNSLTGLPGNHMIDEQLQKTVLLEQFSVLYIDLDYFKSYNDSYGFKMGDVLIQATANLLREAFQGPHSYLGHIGGDDFIVILNHHSYANSCSQVIEQFEALKSSLYKQEDLQNNYVMGDGRSGVYGQIPLVSISIAVVTNQSESFHSVDDIIEEATRIKKLCKSRSGSTSIANECCR